MHHWIKKALRFLFFSCLACLAFYWYAGHKSLDLPPPSELDSQVFNEPIQKNTSKEEYEINYRDNIYTIEPVAEYELWGLLVSHNNILAFDDIYHDESSVDIKDICVIWGDNLKTSNYQKWKFWSEPWSCHYRYETTEEARSFHGTALGNNHLLAQSTAVQQAIQKARIGDQIHLVGNLINYQKKNDGDHWRRSSTTREDDGNGACEVVMVEEFEILKAANKDWRRLEKLSVNLAKFLGACFVVLFLYDTYKQ
jgi:hypothetical protein